jgi:hypothetical protein
MHDIVYLNIPMDFQVLPPLFHPSVFFTLVLTIINITLA